MFVLPCQVVYNCGTYNLSENLSYWTTLIQPYSSSVHSHHTRPGGGSSEPHEPPSIRHWIGSIFNWLFQWFSSQCRTVGLGCWGPLKPTVSKRCIGPIAKIMPIAIERMDGWFRLGSCEIWIVASVFDVFKVSRFELCTHPKRNMLYRYRGE